jgi:hypothetical protein
MTITPQDLVYAQLSSATYPRADQNRTPIPVGWTPILRPGSTSQTFDTRDTDWPLSLSHDWLQIRPLASHLCGRAR